jgi:hypothetical protein
MLLFINILVIAGETKFRQLLSASCLFILFFITLTGYECYAQESDFWLRIDSGKDEGVSELIQHLDNNFYLLGTRSDTTIEIGNHVESFVYKINTSGEIIDSAFYSITNRNLTLQSLTIDTFDSTLLSGISRDSIGGNTDTRIELIRINNLFQVVNHKSYLISSGRDPGWLYAVKNSFNQFIFSGMTFRFPQQPIMRAFYFKSSYNLDSLNYWEYPQLTHNNQASHIKQLNDSVIWACEATVGGFTFVQMDTSFNHINYQKIPDLLSDNFGIKWDTDSSFYILGEWNGGPDDDVGIIRMFDPIDTTGHLFALWGTLDTLDFPATNNGLDFKNKDSIFAGGTTNIFGSNSYFFLTQFDSSLNLRWERFYGGDGYYQMDKIVATNDGGCIMAGTRIDESYPYEKHDAIIIKVNHEGFIVNIHESPAAQAREAIIYPNPGSECLNIRLGRQHAEGWLSLYSITGQPVLSVHLSETITKINTQFLPSGSYIYKINSPEGFNESGIWIKE